MMVPMYGIHCMLTCGATIQKTCTILMQLTVVNNLDQVTSDCCQKVATKNSTLRILACIRNLPSLFYVLLQFIFVFVTSSSTSLLLKNIKMGKMLVTHYDILKTIKSWKILDLIFWLFFCQPCQKVRSNILMKLKMQLRVWNTSL